MKRVLLATLALAMIGRLVLAQSNAPRNEKWGRSSFPPRRPSLFRGEPNGQLVKSFGDTKYRTAHGVRVDRDGFIWATDNADNFVQKISPDGRVLMTLGRSGTTGDNDSQESFDGPADVFVTPNGDIFVADGYRNFPDRPILQGRQVLEEDWRRQRF